MACSCPARSTRTPHLELSHVRVPGGDGLVPWVRRLLAARTPTDVEVGTRGGEGRWRRAAPSLPSTSRTTAAPAPLWADAGIEARVLTERIAPRGEPPASARGRETAHATYSCGPRGAAYAGGAQRRAPGVDPRRRRSGRGRLARRRRRPVRRLPRRARRAAVGGRAGAAPDRLARLARRARPRHAARAPDRRRLRFARARGAQRLHRRPLPALEPAHRQAPPARRWHSRRRAARRPRHRLARLVPHARRPRRRAGAGARRRRSRVARARGHGRRRHRDGRRRTSARSASASARASSPSATISTACATRSRGSRTKAPTRPSRGSA